MTGSFTLVVGAAPEPGGDAFYTDLLASARHVIAADAAAEWCVRLGRSPDVAVGDFDSADPGAQGRLERSGVSVVTLRPDKDLSDLDACVEEVRERGWGPLIITAAFVGRIDHTMAAVGTLMRGADLGAGVEEPSWSATVIDPVRNASRALDLTAGAVFSVLAPSGADGVTIRDARYALVDARLGPLSSIGISNVASGVPVVVTVGSGVVLVVVPRAASVGP